MDRLTPKAVIFDFGSTLVEYPSTTWEEVNAECVEAARQWLEPVLVLRLTGCRQRPHRPAVEGLERGYDLMLLEPG